MATYIVVQATFTPPPLDYNSAQVERGLSATGPWTVIGEMQLTGNRGYYYDNTAPFDTPVWYRVTERDDSGVLLSGAVTLGPFTLAGTGTVVLSDPLRPWADVELGFCPTPSTAAALICSPSGPDLVWTRFGDRAYRADAGLFDILDAERPADVYARRKDHEGSIAFLSKTLDGIERVKTLFTAGGPLYLRAPAAYEPTDFAIQPVDLQEAFLTDRIDQRMPFRIWTAPYVVVDLPLGLQQGIPCATWCAVDAAFPTYANLTAAGGTWGALASGTTVCP